MKEDQASSTAFTVLQGLLYTARYKKELDLVSDETVEVCQKILQDSDEGRRRLSQLDNPLFRIALPTIERLVMPGISLHYALRKRYIEQKVVRAIQDGTTQIVSLGAGFDTLLWRLHQKHPTIHLIEIDHPSTSIVKQAALSVEKKSASTLNFLPVDLSCHSLREVLQEFDGFDPQRKTLFICEGVLMYLDEQAVVTVLKTLQRLTRHPIQFIFSAVAPMNSTYNNTGPLLKFYLMFKGEPLNWTIEREALSGFLTPLDYRIQELADADFLSHHLLKPTFFPPLHRGEFLASVEADPIAG
ncbi:MAG: class I SAM-dependent methyltransferase [Magnetococcales bacterium]|nr:class I SAM-dependent methyltransferase [Magnetococcales bacterium]